MRQLVSLICIIILISAGALASGFYVGTGMVRTVAEKMTAADDDLKDRLTLIEETSLLVANDLHALREGVALESEANEAENSEARALLDAKLSELAGTLGVQETALGALKTETNLTDLIAYWDPFVYDLTCKFKNNDGSTTESSGSAVFEETTSGIRFVTNKHVVEKEKAVLLSCELSRPNAKASFHVEGDEVTLRDDVDVAYGPVNKATLGLPSVRRCTEDPAIGDRVVMLGYPQIGAKESVTATEGIISGFDEDYYTTSAKIEKGNSGGAAVHVKKNCFLGLPTLVFAGRIESLARILPVSEIE
ncbi:MAG: serine protease [Patescibacteria group bacterium]